MIAIGMQIARTRQVCFKNMKNLWEVLRLLLLLFRLRLRLVSGVNISSDADPWPASTAGGISAYRSPIRRLKFSIVSNLPRSISVCSHVECMGRMPILAGCSSIGTPSFMALTKRWCWSPSTKDPSEKAIWTLESCAGWLPRRDNCLRWAGCANFVPDTR